MAREVVGGSGKILGLLLPATCPPSSLFFFKIGAIYSGLIVVSKCIRMHHALLPVLFLYFTSSLEQSRNSFTVKRLEDKLHI